MIYARARLFAFITLTVLGSSGCAMIVHGRHQRIRVASNPPADRVSIVGARHTKQSLTKRSESPVELVLRRDEKHAVIRIEKDGYEPAEVSLKRTASKWLIVGAVGFGSVGIPGGALMGAASGAATAGVYVLLSTGIDALTGSAYRLIPAKVDVTLKPRSTVKD